MRISRLYLKIFFAFVASLVLAAMIMTVLVHFGNIHPPFARSAEERTDRIRRFVEQEVGEATHLSPVQDRQLNRMLTLFAEALQGYVWITDANDMITNGSFQGAEPTMEIDEEIDTHGSEGIRLFLVKNGELVSIYTEADFRLADGRPLTLHLLHHWKKRPAELWLMRALLLMCTIAALILVPVSRQILRPVKELTETAESMARGDFTQRVNEQGRDEVAVLARTFNKMADSLEKMVRGNRELTANMSHELRSPLARIRISQQIMQERLASGETKGVEKHLGKIEREIEHMDGLIDQILKLSKLDLQSSAENKVWIDMEDAVSVALERHEPLFAEKELSVEVDLASVPPVACNEDGLRVVLDNVLTNAAKYTASKGRVCVATSSLDDAVVIEVCNTYPVLESEELEAVFVPFTRLGYDAEEGTGLGLAYCRRIVEEHGGSITAESVVRNGENRFLIRIVLPRA